MNGQTPYRRLYPNQEVLVFDGGLNTKFEKALLEDNESPDCLNVEFVNGAVQTRQGSVRVNTTPAGSVPFDGLYTRRSSDGTTEQMCAFIGGDMRVLNATTFNTVPSAQSVFTIGNRVGADLAENYLFIGNGGAGPYKYDGSVFSLHGVPAPLTTISVATGTTGSLTINGTYRWGVTFVNTALVEGNLSPLTATFTVGTTALAANLTNIPVASFPSYGVNARYVYRTLTGTNNFFRVTKILDNTTTTFTDTVADTSLGSAAPTDNGTPPLYNAIIYKSNILFVNDAANPNFVWYSTIGQPYTFPSTNFFKVGDKAGDLVKSFAAFDNYIVIFCENSTWINYMPNPADPTTWRQIQTNSPYGSRSKYSALKCNVRGTDIVLFPAFQKKFVGFAGLNGTTLDPSSSLQPATTAGSDLESQVIEPDMFQVQETFLNNISGIVYKNRAFITLTYGSGQTTNNRIYVWDFSISNIKKRQKESWVPWTGMNIQQFTIYSGKLYGASSTSNGYVYQVADTGVYNDDGSAINSYFYTKEYSGFERDTSLTKDFRYFNFLYDNVGSYFMNFTYKTDSDLGTGTSVQVSLTSNASVWGTGANGLVWGTGTWGGGVGQTDSRVFFGGSIRGKRIQFKFDNQNTANQRFVVHRGQFLYNIKGYR